LELGYENLGERQVKNIAEPVRVYRVGIERKIPAVDPDAAAVKPPDKPSIAVLAFANMSGDPEQEYFSDGLTEDIITELSKFRELFVIARNSTFAYKGKDVNIQEIGKDLGVRYVVEGSVRKAGNRVRINAQLIDAATGNHVWAQRYDRDLEDIFAVQDEITQTVVASLAGRLEAADLERTKRKPIESMAAYDYLLRGKDHHHRFTKEDNAQGLRALHKAVELDPRCAPAYAWLACTYGQAWARGYLEDSEMALERCVEAAQKSYALDETDAECHRILCAIHLLRRQYDQAEFHQDRAIALNPNAPLIVSQRGYLLTILGRADEGVEWVQKAMRLDPIHPDLFGSNLGIALFTARRYPEAVHALTRITAPQLSHHAYLAACYAEMDAAQELQGRRAKIIELEPDFSARGHAEGQAFKQAADEKHLRDALIKAGLPE
jgi:adenylate cyclase